MEKVKRKDRKSKTNTFLVVMFLVLYLPSLWNWIYGTSISTDIIREGVIEDSINTDAYIIRDEEQIISQFEGIYIPKAGEGDRVPANYEVATVLNQSAVKLLDDLEEKNKNLLKIQNENLDTLSIFNDDIEKIDKKINEKIAALVDQININNLDSCNGIKLQIDELTKKKITILGGNITNNAYYKQLKKERDQLQEQVDQNTKEIITKSPGIISYNVDNYESILTPESINKLTPELLNNIKINDNRMMNDNQVSAGKPFARIIKGNTYYLVVCLDYKFAEFLKEGKRISVRFNDIGKTVDTAYIYYKSEEIDGKCIVAIKVDRYANETSALRKINIDLIKEYNEGLKVPLKSLKNVDLESGKAYIVMVEANCAVTREVAIKGSNNDFAIIDNPEGSGKKYIGLYDTYVVNPINIEEGQIIN
ncbi:MAG TPA: hypothetical protein GXX20_02290 [Clostridiaceae bacterium]|nr:hypothetical protein [Clostridiaceae bacterium]